MTRRFLRVGLAALALFLTAAGSVNLRRANAVSCDECGVPPGANVACAFYLPDGTYIECYGE
jgi:hypothetical protein